MGLLGFVNTSHETAVDNRSATPYIAEVTDTRTSFYAVPPGALVVVDVLSEGDLGGDFFLLFDAACQQVANVDIDFSRGGLVTITNDGRPTAIPNRVLSVDPEVQDAAAKATCTEAAATL
jgi:hypothetical protein